MKEESLQVERSKIDLNSSLEQKSYRYKFKGLYKYKKEIIFSLFFLFYLKDMKPEQAIGNLSIGGAGVKDGIATSGLYALFLTELILKAMSLVKIRIAYLIVIAN